jgi:uncharacterized membrane protein
VQQRASDEWLVQAMEEFEDQRVKTRLAAIGAAAAIALVAPPLIGWPSLLRLPAILAPAMALALLITRPWRWSEQDLDTLDAWQPSARVLASAAVVAGLVLFWILLTRFRSGDINAVDFTVYFDRPVFQTLHGRPLFVETSDLPAFSHRSMFGVHAYWILVPLAGLYAIHATPYWLLALSVVSVVAGAIHVARIAQRIGMGGILAGATAIAFVLNANTARTLLYGFHPEVLYAWFIPAALDAGLHRRRTWFLAAVIACVLVKEDACFALFGVSVALALHAGRTMTARERGVFLIAPPLVALVNLAVFDLFVVPRLTSAAAPVYAVFWTNYGPTPLRALLGMAAHPLRVFGAILTSGFLRRVIVPHAFLPLVGWRWMIGALPLIALYSASANPQIREFGLYYSVMLVPFLVIAASVGGVRMARLVTVRERSARLGAAVVVVLAALLAYGDRAGYSLRPWKPEIAMMPDVIRQLSAERAVLVQSGLYPHAGYDERVVLLTPDTLGEPHYAGAAVVLGPRVDAYPFRKGELDRLQELAPVLPATSGLLVVRLPAGR